MPKRMLIDASHPEETRVVVIDGQRVEEFDFEAASKRPLKGNIYLAKVTRVEPSLQAAFVEYGGNRQGFLAFSEIHPDYYQVPVADRMAILAEQQAEARQRQEDDIESFDISPGAKRGSRRKDKDEADEEPAAEAEAGEAAEPVPSEPEPIVDAGEEVTIEFIPPAEEPPENGDEIPEAATEEEDGELVSSEPAAEGKTPATGFEEPVADLPSNDGAAMPEPEARREPAQALDAKRPSQRWMRRRHYKIQEVIKRRQIILVQVVKEERGNKGAALTTYLSLAGRYCVLMPNTPRGGGISRKITNAADRKRLKSAAQSLDLPEGMGLIIRTAGENRTKLEIKRDYEYLLRLWDTIRELTLKSTAPACVHEEGDLIKRAIRDLYNKDVTEVLVEGEDGYRNAKDFMRMLMPSHAKNVKPYKEPVPLFQRHHIEAQLDAMFSPSVTLRSGGYIVINQTEALVSIDVNSGRATREHSIEETATKTNLEAADEIGRQLRLRDLAGLIVIDFIDMEDGRNDRLVEKRLHNAVKNDRARVQIGKISQFGLLEMSRQRLRAGVIAGSTVPCPHCGGQGIVRSVESTSLRVLRALEEEAQKQRCDGMAVHVADDVVVYTGNQKRRELVRIENEYDVAISLEPKEGLKAGDFEIDRIGQRDPASRPKLAALETPAEPEAAPEPEIEEPEEAEETAAGEIAAQSPPQHQQREGEGGGRRRRRRRRRGGRDRGFDNAERREQQPLTPSISPASDLAMPNGAATVPEGETAGMPQAERVFQGDQQGQPGEGGGRRRRRRRRRGRRGGRDRDFFGGEQQRGEQAGDDQPKTEQSGGEPRLETGGTPAPIFYEDRFGIADDIDTTPREEPREPERTPVAADVVEPAEEAEPNAASTPVWSLEAEAAAEIAPVPVAAPPEEPVAEGPRPRTRSRRTAHEKRTVAARAETAVETRAEPASEPVPGPDRAKIEETGASTPLPEAPAPEPLAAEAPEVREMPKGPPKKGWWQRTFRPE
ncbi:MAG TPA: ribonuclease E/G [Rhizomicrobium sp.]|nr:ribonuclease E/G [Rhizomicrobium sp.]